MTTQAKVSQSTLFGGQIAEQSFSPAQSGGFLRCYDEYFGRVFTYTRYRCGDDALADDLTAHIFERAFACWAEYDPQRGPLSAWLFAIARNVISNHFRAEAARQQTSLERCEQQPDAAALPEETLIQGETQAELLQALAFLSERERDLLGLKFSAGLTNRRIAEITGLSEANVGVILYRSLQRLRSILTERRKSHER